MTWTPPTGSFTVEKPITPSGGWDDPVLPTKAPWHQSSVSAANAPALAWQSDENLKKSFGIELAKATTAFEAAGKVSGEDASKALWISVNWLNDPIVVASRDAYLKTLALSSPPLDKEQLAAKVLALADEKVISPRTGLPVPSIEAKDRIAAFKLYSEIMGYTGKVEIDASTKTINHNEMTIKLVKAETKAPAIIDQNPNKNSQSQIANESPSPITLKLVGELRVKWTAVYFKLSHSAINLGAELC